MTHTFATDFGASDFDAATVADGAFVADAFIFTAMTFPIASGAEDTFAEEAVAFGLECAVINGFGLFYFAVGPSADFIGRGEGDLHRIEEINVEHDYTSEKRLGKGLLEGLGSSSSSSLMGISPAWSLRTRISSAIDCNSLIKTLKDSGTPGVGIF